MTFVGIEEMTIRYAVSNTKNGLRLAIEHAIQEARDQTARSAGGNVRTRIRFRVGGHTITVGPDDDPIAKYNQFKHLDPELQR